MAWRLPVKSGYDFPGFFSLKILPLKDFTWLPPGHDFTSLERDTRGTRERPGGRGGVGSSNNDFDYVYMLVCVCVAWNEMEWLHSWILPGIHEQTTCKQTVFAMFTLLMLFVYKWKGCHHFPSF